MLKERLILINVIKTLISCDNNVIEYSFHIGAVFIINTSYFQKFSNNFFCSGVISGAILSENGYSSKFPESVSLLTSGTQGGGIYCYNTDSQSTPLNQGWFLISSTPAY